MTNHDELFSGLRNASWMSKDGLFLCDSGDEIISAKDRCDIKKDCYDHSDEKNCTSCKYYLVKMLSRCRRIIKSLTPV